MAFKITARTILELGAELISSDGVALYELIKNAMDAGSRRVTIAVRVALPRSQYDTLIEEIDTHPGSLADLRSTVEAALEDVEERRRAKLFEKVAAAPTAASLRRAVEQWYVRNNYITVTDVGHGMSMDDLSQVYLTVGTRSRLRQRNQLGAGGTAPLGEKGVGRLSTMRLGTELRVETSKAGEPVTNSLVIDWTRFSHSSDALLEDIVIEPSQGETKEDSSTSGTVVTVGGLLAEWSMSKLDAIAREEFARLVDPWEGRTANRIMRLTFNGERVYVPEIDRRYLDVAHGHCTASYAIVRGEPVLTGEVEYRLRGKSKGFRLGAAELLSAAKAGSLATLRSLGAFDMEMWWFNRQAISAKEELGSKKEILEEIAKWSGGLMVFRDGFRVNPYGSGEDDWLELDRRAFAARGYKLNRQQVVGRVRISWTNRALLDQTNREGLVSTPERDALTTLLRYVLLGEFKTFIEAEDNAVRVQESTTLETITERIQSAGQSVTLKLREIEGALPASQRALANQASGVVKELVGYLDEAKELGEEYVRDRAQLVYLAGVGLMVEFVLHELDRATFGTLRTLKDLDTSKVERATAASLRVLSDQLETLNKRVSNLDALSTARRQVKSEFDVYETVQRIVASREGEARRLGVAVDGTYAARAQWPVKAVPGMFLQVIENLLANSFYWLRRQGEVETGFKPRVTIDVDRSDRTIRLTDNGPGVDPTMAESIFQAFVTRKPAGEGRGLGLYISREIAQNQGWHLDIAREHTVRPDRYNTFTLDMSGARR